MLDIPAMESRYVSMEECWAVAGDRLHREREGALFGDLFQNGLLDRFHQVMILLLLCRPVHDFTVILTM